MDKDKGDRARAAIMQGDGDLVIGISDHHETLEAPPSPEKDLDGEHATEFVGNAGPDFPDVLKEPGARELAQTLGTFIMEDGGKLVPATPEKLLALDDYAAWFEQRADWALARSDSKNAPPLVAQYLEIEVLSRMGREIVELKQEVSSLVAVLKAGLKTEEKRDVGAKVQGKDGGSGKRGGGRGGGKKHQ